MPLEGEFGIDRDAANIAEAQRLALTCNALPIWLGDHVAARLAIAHKAFLLVAVVILGGGAFAVTPEAAFLAENQTAMRQMMAGMNITPSGDVDRDFAARMAVTSDQIQAAAKKYMTAARRDVMVVEVK